MTKRTVLSTTAQFYDLIGLFLPVIILLKILFQKMCHLKLNWDDIIPQELCSQWVRLVNDIAKFNCIVFSWYLLKDVCTEKLSTIELHGFCDASQNCYAACVYL